MPRRSKVKRIKTTKAEEQLAFLLDQAGFSRSHIRNILNRNVYGVEAAIKRGYKLLENAEDDFTEEEEILFGRLLCFYQWLADGEAMGYLEMLNTHFYRSLSQKKPPPV